MNARLCTTVTAPTMAALREERDRAALVADLVELRLDTVADPDVAGALQGRTGQVILTCRAAWEGGAFKGSEEERRRMLAAALDADAEYVDVEWRAGFTDLLTRRRGRGIVLSSHDFSGVPRDLAAQLREMKSTGVEVVKVAVKAQRLSDCLPLLAAKSDDEGPRAVLIAMGPAGLVTRVLAGRFGSPWGYAGAVSDVGQVTPHTLLNHYRFRRLSETTSLYGVTGSPLGHSVSPAMHNAAFADEGIDAVYLPLPAADTDDFLAFAGALRLQGASVTIPFKVALFEQVTDVDSTARQIGALNTLRACGDGWTGRNTDAAGFLRPLDDLGVALQGVRAAILGAGGSARAVAVALSSRGADVTVHARDSERAARVATLAGGRVGEWPIRPARRGLIVNCTPLGMLPRVDESPVDPAVLDAALVYDLVYNPRATRLLRDARAAGCPTIGGLEMLVAQAVEQFAWWTDRRPKTAVMRAAATARLAEFNDR
jgi:3-dehydroquinate dehydratase/shikimate dehydrogenase